MIKLESVRSKLVFFANSLVSGFLRVNVYGKSWGNLKGAVSRLEKDFMSSLRD